MKLTTLIIALLIAVGTTFAQKGVEDGSKYGHGEDSLNCLKNSSLYFESYKNNNYKAAYPYWLQVFNECPLSSSNVYTAGAKMLRSLIEEEQDTVKKEEYYQQLMKVHDQRIKYYGKSKKFPESYILGWKAIDILRFKKDDVPSMIEAYEISKKSIASRGVESMEALLNIHISNSIDLYRADKITAEDVVDDYTLVADVYDSKIKAAPENEEIQGYVALVEKIVAESGVMSCEKMEEIFGSKFEENKENISWLKRVNRILNQQLCENDLTFKVSENLHTLEPSSSSARGMAVKCLKSKDYNGAVNYYQEAIELEENSKTKGGFYYELGLVYMAQTKFPEARNNFKKAAELKTNWGLPYIQIGLVYGYAAPNCGDSDFEHKCANWAAVDKFEYAKKVDPSVTEEANKHIKTFSAFFPNQEELFFNSAKIGNVGDSYTVGCWINEKTTIRAKK
ncbi:MAG: tetratricopeptide repeat protein [Marinilabiliaceae bacterium]|nr:tetratricopeptide repeat protein [Marinilabiliaceae bacterium]